MRILKYNLLIKLLGEAAIESYYLDTFLEAFKDGIKRDISLIETSRTQDTSIIEERVIERLTKDGYLKHVDSECYRITSIGKSFLATGGYSSKIVYEKLSKISIWLSLAALLTSLIAFARTFF